MNSLYQYGCPAHADHASYLFCLGRGAFKLGVGGALIISVVAIGAILGSVYGAEHGRNHFGMQGLPAIRSFTGAFIGAWAGAHVATAIFLNYLHNT